MSKAKNTCTACGGLVVVGPGLDADGEPLATCARCGPVELVGTVGDIDLTKPSPPRYAPLGPGFACLSCGAPLGDADDCPACGASVPVVFGTDDGRRVQGVMRREDLAKLPGAVLDDGEEIPF